MSFMFKHTENAPSYILFFSSVNKSLEIFILFYYN